MLGSNPSAVPGAATEGPGHPLGVPPDSRALRDQQQCDKPNVQPSKRLHNVQPAPSRSRRTSTQRVRYFSLGSSILKEASWRKLVESGGKGKVTGRDGVLVGHYRGTRFGALDEIWFKDRQGHALYLRVNTKITEDQAVALAKAAMD